MPDNLWDGLDDARAAASDASLNAAWKLDPERQAKVQALARQMGVTPVTADTEFDQLDAMRKREAAAALLEKAPATRQFLTHPDHAAIAHDQTEALARIEQKARRTPAGSIDLIPRGEVFGFDYLKAFAESPVGNISSGIVGRTVNLGAGLGRSLFGLVDKPADLLASGAEALGIPTIIDFTSQGVKFRMQTPAEKQSLTGGGVGEKAIRAGEGFKTAYKPGTSWQDVKRQPVAKFLPFALEQGIVSAPDMAAAVLALPAYVAARTGEIGKDRATNDLRPEATVEDLFAALPAAAGSAMLERLGTRGIVGLDDALKGGLKGVPAAVGRASLKEGLTEAGQQVLESLGATVGTKTGVDGAALLDETLAAAVGGAGFGGVVRTGTGAMEAFAGQTRTAEAAKVDAARLDDLVAEVTDNPLTARDPDAMKAFLDGVTAGDEIHIPAKVVMAYMQARRFDDVAAVLDDWGIADQMQEAMAADADVVVDASVYLSKIAPTAHDAFKEDLRVGSGSMSLREAAEFDAGRDGGLQDAAQKVLDQATADQQAAAPAEQVYQTLYSQALDAGFVPDVARQYAELWAARYNARAARSPDLYANALDAYNASRVTVRADLPEALKTRIDKIDVVINALRARAKPDAGEALLGPSLLTFVSKQGGIVDTGGELAGLDAGTWHKGKVGKRKIIRDERDPADTVNYGPERVAERAFDAGYIAEPTQEALLAAVREELAGRLQFPTDARNQTTQAREDFGQALDQLDEILGRLGLNVDTATNEQIKAAVEAYAADPQGAMGYEQPADGSGMAPRGRIDLMGDRSRVITLFESRDLSTLLHEGGHLWLEELRQDAAIGSASAAAELATINAWFAKNGLVDPVDQHEAWARASEAYLMEGKAPSLNLKAAFSRFRSWLLSLYRTAAGLNTPINDDIRGVMDRLLATDAEIEAARATVAADPMFATATDAGMTDAEFAAYSRTVQRARDATHDALLVKVMNAIARQRTAEWKAEAESLRPDAVETVDAAPEMRALNWLRSNRQALSREAVIDVLGDASAVAMLPKGVPPLISDKAGAHPDSLADVAGYQTGEEMLRGLMSIEAERQAMKAKDDKRSVRTARIDAEVARIQAERHGDPFTDGSIQREAMDAIHHERQGELLAEEMRALGRKTGDRPAPLSILREWARATVAAKRMREATRTDRYLRAERKAANAAQQAAAKGDNATALKEKQTQTLNHLLYNESTKAAVMAERSVKLFSRYAKARTLKGMDQEYLEQIHGLLEQYDFAPTTLRGADRRASLAAWVEKRRGEGEEVAISDDLLTRAGKTSYVNMTMEELTGLYDAVRSIAHLGRLKQKLLDGREQREFEAVIDEALSQTQDLKTVRDLSIANPKKNWAAMGDAALIKVETMLDWLDRGDVNGIFNRLLIRPATDAANREGQLREKISKALGEHREAVPKAQRKAWLNAWTSPLLLEPRTGLPLKMQRGDLIAMALNTGNASNLDKLAKGYGWNADTILNVLDATLTKEEWDYVQSVWDTLETLWPDIAATERKLSGVEPERVVPQEVMTRHGPLRGGYYPVVYDYERTAAAPAWAAKEAADMFKGVFYSAGTPKGHTKARTGFSAPVTLSVSRVLGGHVNKVIKRVAYGDFVVSAKKFIEDGRIRQIIQAKLGSEYYALLTPWLQRQVVDQVIPSSELAGWEAFIRKARVNFQIVAMGFRATTALAQVAGLTSSAAVIGPQWVAKGMAETVRLVATGNLDFVWSRSPEMEQRSRELDRDLRDAMRDFEDGEGLLDPIRRAAFMHIGFMDRYMVAVPTWLGAYGKAITEGLSEDDAIAASDKAVRTSQGSGRAKDLSAIQAPNSEFMRLFTLFYSYFNVQYQRQRDIGRAVGRGDVATAFNMSFFMLFAAPLAGALLTGDKPDEDEGWLQWVAAKVFANLWAGIPVARDISAYVERKVRGKYTEYTATPLAGVVGSVEDSLGDIIKLVKDGEPGDRWIKHAIQTPGYFVGLPTGQASSTFQYLFDMMDGDQNPEHVGEFAYGLVKGPQKDQE